MPPGALSEPTVVVVGTAPVLDEPPTDAQGAGPTVFFGPEGLEFQEDVEITLPFDPTTYSGDMEDVEVFTRDEDGNVEEVENIVDVDPDAGTVTAEVSHFSSFRVFLPERTFPPFDLNADEISDLVIPAPLAASGRGAIHVFFGPVANGLDSTNNSDVLIDGLQTFDGLGGAISVADVSGDAVPDLIASHLGSVPGVSIFHGGSGFNPIVRSDDDVSLAGVTVSDDFGTDIDVGDVNDDGLPDLVVGAAGTSSGTGSVYVFFGGSTALEPSASTVFASAADLTFNGSATDDLFGQSVAVGDVNGDGVDDIVVGSPQTDQASGLGLVYVFFGDSNIASGTAGNVILVGPTLQGAFGTQIQVGRHDGRRHRRHRGGRRRGRDLRQPGRRVRDPRKRYAGVRCGHCCSHADLAGTGRHRPSRRLDRARATERRRHLYPRLVVQRCGRRGRGLLPERHDRHREPRDRLGR